MTPSRRSFLAGSAGLVALAVDAAYAPRRAQGASAAGAADNAAPTPNADRSFVAAREPFAVRSTDGVMLAGEVQGDRQAPEILFIHGLRQSRLSWEKQFADPALAGFRLVGFDLRGHGDCWSAGPLAAMWPALTCANMVARGSRV